MKDSVADNLAVTSIMNKQLGLYDINSMSLKDEEKAAFKAIQPQYEYSFQKNYETYRNFTEKYENHLFCVNNTFEDVSEAVRTIDQFYDYKIECLDRIKSLVIL